MVEMKKTRVGNRLSTAQVVSENNGIKIRWCVLKKQNYLFQVLFRDEYSGTAPEGEKKS
jgi:hypothetical protein